MCTQQQQDEGSSAFGTSCPQFCLSPIWSKLKERLGDGTDVAVASWVLRGESWIVPMLQGTNKAATLRPLGLKRLCVQSKQTDELDYLVPALKAPGLTALSLSCRSASGIIKHLPYFEKLAGQNCRIEILSALGFNSLEKISLQNVGLMVQNNTAERIQKGKLRNKSSTKLTCFEQSLQLMRGASDVEKRMIPKRYMQQAIQS